MRWGKEGTKWLFGIVAGVKNKDVEFWKGLEESGCGGVKRDMVRGRRLGEVEL